MEDPNLGVAWGEFHDELNSTGWMRLYVYTSPSKPPLQAMHGAGYLEGYLTQQRITEYNHNMWSGVDYTPAELFDFFSQQWQWMMTNIQKYAPKDPYWQHVQYQVEQLEGMTEGYNAASPKNNMSYIDMYMLASWYDLDDIVAKLKPEKRPKWDAMSVEEINNYLSARMRCSSLVKVTGDLSELYAAHTTWFSYRTMSRILKIYNFPLNGFKVASKIISFPSYPGSLSSLDDFYLTESGLVVMETTNEILNHELYDYVNTTQLLSWMRVMLANRLAHNGEEWTQIYSLYNSGTYNNQWIVVDYKKFVPRKPLPKGTLWISEQIPGYIHSEDMTEVLQFGYWPSYNIPYFHDITVKSGWNILVARNASLYSHAACPRANIFRRDQSKVTDMNTFKSLMRYNNWEYDPYSLGYPSYTISARNDLTGIPGNCHGGIDSKLVSSRLVRDLEFVAISGPTYDQQPPFQWFNSRACQGVEHVGLPDVWRFGWVNFRAQP